jgi:hypothetical protein
MQRITTMCKNTLKSFFMRKTGWSTNNQLRYQRSKLRTKKAKQAAASYEQVFKNAVVKKDTTDANGGFNLNYNEEIEVKSAEFQDPNLQ